MDVVVVVWVDVVGGWVVTIGIVVAGSAKNSWVEEKERDRGERDKEREEE